MGWAQKLIPSPLPRFQKAGMKKHVYLCPFPTWFSSSTDTFRYLICFWKWNDMVPHARFIYQLASTFCISCVILSLIFWNADNKRLHLCHKIFIFAFCILHLSSIASFTFEYEKNIFISSNHLSTQPSLYDDTFSVVCLSFVNVPKIVPCWTFVYHKHVNHFQPFSLYCKVNECLPISDWSKYQTYTHELQIWCN